MNAMNPEFVAQMRERMSTSGANPAADNKESNGNFLNSSSILLVYSIHLIFSPPNFDRRFLANYNISFVFLRSDFKLSASYVLVEN